jgi:hypothetical protein
MEVNSVSNNGIPPTGNEHVSSVRRHQNHTDEAELHSPETLRNLIDQHPAVRADEVERGQILLADVQYPPAELINGLSRLLAEHMLNRS